MKGKTLKEKTSKQRGVRREKYVREQETKRAAQKEREREKKIDCVGELVVVKRSQTLRPSPQPHLHKLQRLPLPSPAAGPAINTFSITSTREQKGRGGGGGDEGGERRTPKERVDPLDETTSHEAQMCCSGGPHHRAPAHVCSLITGWPFVSHLTEPGSESSSAPASTLMEHLQ